MSFQDIDIKPEYRSLLDNVVSDFYNPLLSESILYRRAVGFFSSSALIEITNGIQGLLQNNGSAQEVKHYHLHLKPFYEGIKTMELVKYPENIKEPKEIFDKLKNEN